MNLNKTVFADYQSTTPVDPRVLDRMTPHWNESFGNPHSGDHVVGWRAAAAVEEAQQSVANLIGADPDEIIFTSGATEANNLAILGLARRAPPTRRRIVISAIEHKCVLAAARHLETHEGFDVHILPVNSEGFVDLDNLTSYLDDTVLLASIMLVNNEIGTVQNVSEIASILARYGVVFHCDAAQAPAAMDVNELGQYADLVSLSGHKIYGPQGIGALYIRRHLQEQVEPLIYGGGQQNGLRSGTLPLALCVGMGAASDLLANPDAASERQRVGQQRDAFLFGLAECGVKTKLNGPSNEHRHPGNANLQFPGFSAQDILGMLQPNLAASTGAACSSGIPEPSHVLQAIGLSDEQADSSVRFSFGRFTTDEDTRRAANYIFSIFESLSHAR